jgi:carbon monoxide dehydrogenase subunit G
MMNIEGEIVIGRPIDVVFDFVADERNEPTFNPRLLRAEQITEGPIGKGTRFKAATRSMGRTVDMVIEFTAYERPTRLVSTTSMSSADIRGTLTFEPDPAGTRMSWSWDVKPRGAVKLLAPLIARTGKHQEEAIWTNLKQHLEAAPTPAS